MKLNSSPLMTAAALSCATACTLGGGADLESANVLDFDPAECASLIGTNSASMRIEPIYHGDLDNLGLLTQRDHYQLRILACADATSLTRPGHLTVTLLDDGDEPFRVFRYPVPPAANMDPDERYAYFATDAATGPDSAGDVIWGNDALRTHRVEVALTSTGQEDSMPPPASESVQPPLFDFELCSPANPTEMHVWMDDWRSIKARGCHLMPEGAAVATTLELQAIDNDAGSNPRILWNYTVPAGSTWIETHAVEAVRFKVDGSGEVRDEDQHIRRIRLLVNGVVAQTFEVCRYSTNVRELGCLFDPDTHPCFSGHNPDPLEMECKHHEAFNLGVDFPQ